MKQGFLPYEVRLRRMKRGQRPHEAALTGQVLIRRRLT